MDKLLAALTATDLQAHGFTVPKAALEQTSLWPDGSFAPHSRH